MIEQVFSLQRDGNEQPQFYLLRFRYAGMGQGYKQTIESGTEAYLRGVLTQGGIPVNQINQLFTNAH